MNGLWCGLIILLSCAFSGETGNRGNPHQPKTFTWKVINEAGDVASTSAPYTGASPQWPTLQVDLCHLAAGGNSYWGLPSNYLPIDKAPHGSGINERYVGCDTVHRRTNIRETEFYVCPGAHRDRALNYKCGYRDTYYCASWGCETTGDAYWKPSSSWDYIIVKKGWKNSQRNSTLTAECRNSDPNTKGWCNPLIVTFTEAGKKVTSEEWARGFEWGIRFYVTNRDPGLTFKIKLDIKNTSSSPVGPNKVLPDQGSPKAPAAPPAAPPSKAPMSPPRGHNSSTGSPVTSAPSTLSTLIHTVPPHY